MKIITIGRSSECDIIINDPYVGRTHLQMIVSDDGSCYCVDLNSKNGTFVNGRRISSKVRLNKTDVIRIGNTTLPWQQYVGVPMINKSRKPFWITMIAVGVVLLACVGLGIYYNYNSEPKTERAIINSLKEFGHSKMPASFNNLWSDNIDRDVAFEMWKEIEQSGNRYGIDWTSLEYYDSYHKTKEIDNETFTYGALMMSFNSSSDYVSYLVWYIADSSGKIVVLNDNWSRQLITIDDKILDSLNDVVDDFSRLKEDIVKPKKSYLKRTNAKPTADHIQYDLIGHTLSEGVSDGYHEKDWTYEIKNNSISFFDIENILVDDGNSYTAVASCHLKGGDNYYYDTKLKISYSHNESGWKLSYVNSLGMNVVSDGQYDDCIICSLADDGWGGVNCLNIRNISECSLVVAGRIRTSYNGWLKFSKVVSPHKSIAVGGTFSGGSVQDYIIDFVVREQ